MSSGEFKVHYIDFGGCVGFETIKAANRYNAADLVRARLPVDEIISISEIYIPD